MNIARYFIHKSVMTWVVTFILLGAAFVSLAGFATSAKEVAGNGNAKQGSLPAAIAEPEEHGLPQKAVEVARPLQLAIAEALMEQPYAIGLILLGMTPCAPFMPMMVKKARGDLAYTGAIVLLAAIGTVAFMPFAVPRMLAGLTTDAWLVGKPLLFFVLVPLLVGIAVKSFAEPVVSRLYPLVKNTTDITTMVMLAVMAIAYGEDFIGAIGSYAIGTLALFVGVVTLATHRLGFGLKQQQRSVLTIGMCTRNLGAAIAPLMTIKADSRSIVMVALGIPVTLIFSFLAASWYASHLPQNEPVGR